MTERPTPAVRASDADRERVAEALRTAGADGQLDLDELDERLQAAYSARTRAELEPLTADLQLAGAPAAGRSFSVRPGEGGTRWVLSIMGGADRRGHWRVGRRCTVVNVMGGSDLDLTHAELAGEETELRVFSLMGGSDVYVPAGVNVQVSQFAFMGGNDVKLGPEPPVPGQPVLRVRLISVMGGTSVRRGPRLSRAERRALQAQRRHGHP